MYAVKVYCGTQDRAGQGAYYLMYAVKVYCGTRRALAAMIVRVDYDSNTA